MRALRPGGLSSVTTDTTGYDTWDTPIRGPEQWSPLGRGKQWLLLARGLLIYPRRWPGHPSSLPKRRFPLDITSRILERSRFVRQTGTLPFCPPDGKGKSGGSCGKKG